MVRDVFISHSAQDKEVAETICAALEEAAIRCWVAPRDVRPGKSFPGEITRAIQQSKVMLLIFSRHSNSSEQVLREVQLAADCHVPIVRLRIEDITLSDDLRYYLSTPQYLDALTSPLSKHIPRLEAAIRELLEQSTEESATSAAASPTGSIEVVAKNRAPAPGAKTPVKWKPFVIAAAVLLAAAVAIFAWRSGRITKQESASVIVSRTPEPTATATPPLTPTAAPQATPTPAAVTVAQTPTASPQAQSMEAMIDEMMQSTQAMIDEMAKKGPLPPEPLTEQADPSSDSPLVRVTNTRYGFSALIPPNVFPIPQTTFTADRQMFTSYDGRAVLTLYVEPNRTAQYLKASYEQWAAEHTKTEPDKIVDYKVLRDNWFVVSGQKGGRGFYLKAVAKRDVVQFMYLDCDANRYPVNGTMLKAMSRAFDGN